MKTNEPSDLEIRQMVQEIPPSGKKRSIGVMAAVATLGSLLFGYDTGVIAGALPFMYLPEAGNGLALNSYQEGLVGAVLAIGAAFGAICGGRLSDRYGRRSNILLLAGIFIVGTLGCTLAPNLTIMYISRFILGIAVGGASSTVPIYLSETAPQHIRGPLVAIDQFMIVFGQLLAYSLNAWISYSHGGPQVQVDLSSVPSDVGPLGGDWVSWDQAQHWQGLVVLGGNGIAWRYMLVLATIPAIALWIGMRLMPESSRWYAAKERYHEAIGSLKRIREEDNDQITEEITQMVEVNRQEQQSHKWTLRETVQTKWTRKILVIGLFLGFFDQLTGINSAMYYLPKVLHAAGFPTQDAIILNVVTGIVATVGAAFGLFLVAKLMRRHVGIYQEAGISISLFSLAIVFAVGVQPHVDAEGNIASSIAPFVPWLILILISIFVFVKQSGTVNWVLVSEIFPSHIRGVAQGFAVGGAWLMNAAVTFSFPPMVEHLGAAWTYGIFGAINVCALLFYMFIVPETKTSTLEELEEKLRVEYSR